MKLQSIIKNTLEIKTIRNKFELFMRIFHEGEIFS